MITEFRTYIDNSELPRNDKLAREILLTFDNFCVIDNLLYRFVKLSKHSDMVHQLVIPEIFRMKILKCLHDDSIAAHLGFNKTMDKLKQRYYWSTINKDTKNYIASCDKCAEHRTNRHKELAPLIPLPVVGYPFEWVSVDFLGPLPKTHYGKLHVLCFALFSLAHFSSD